MPSTSSSSSTDVKPPLSVAPREDRVGRHRPDAGQGVEGRLVGGVEVDERLTAGGRGVERAGHARGRGDADEDLLAVDDAGGRG